jgi:hypothetical protein
MNVIAVKPAPPPMVRPVEVMVLRLSAVSIGEGKTQTAYAIIGALEQEGWVIVRKRHFGGRP